MRSLLARRRQRRAFVERIETPAGSVAVHTNFGSLDATDPRPLVVGLHGFGADEQQMGTLVPLHALADEFTYVSLRGGWTVDSGGFAWHPVHGEAIEDLASDPVEALVAVSELVDTLASLAARPGVAGGGVWLVGYSQGAPIALRALLSSPELVRGVAVGAGAIDESDVGAVDLAGRSVFVANSTIDRYVPETAYSAMVDAMRRAGATVVVHPAAAPHVITEHQAERIGAWLAASAM